MASAAFDALFVQHAMTAYARQLAFADLIENAGGWDVDLKQGALSFADGPTLKAGILGSYGAGAKSWLWAWANKSMADLPSGVTSVAERMRELGTAKNIPEFADPETSVNEDFCHRIAMIAVGESGAGAYYRGPYDGGAAFLILPEPIPRPADAHRLLRIQRVIAESISTFDLPHRPAVDAYLKAEGLDARRIDDGEMLVQAEDGEIRLRFDENGRIAEMKNLLHAAKPKGGWLKRLLGKD